MNIIIKTLPLFVAVSLPVIGFCASPAEDEAEIRKLESRQENAWNQHDAKAYASLFTEDGDCVNIVGWWWKGRTEIEQKLTAGYRFVFAQSALKLTNIDVRFLAPDVAVAHVRWTMTGARTPGSLPKPQEGIQTQVLQRQADSKWLINVFQNTLSVPETPFPVGPPAMATPAP